MTNKERIKELEAELAKWDELHKAVCKIHGVKDSWPSHGNKQFAIAVLLQLRVNDWRESQAKLSEAQAELAAERTAHKCTADNFDKQCASHNEGWTRAREAESLNRSLREALESMRALTSRGMPIDDAITNALSVPAPSPEAKETL